MAAHSSTLAGNSHGWRSMVGYSPWDRKESDTTKWLYFFTFTACPNANPRASCVTSVDTYMCENRSLFSSVFKLPFSVKIQQSIHSFKHSSMKSASPTIVKSAWQVGCLQKKPIHSSWWVKIRHFSISRVEVFPFCLHLMYSSIVCAITMVRK